MPFTKATKEKARARVLIAGPAGSGKTYTALSIAEGLGGRIALIDTERGSASKYADRWEFDSLELVSFSPQQYIEAIEEARGYDVLIIDSLSHAWAGRDGILEYVDRIKATPGTKNQWTEPWSKATPLQNKLIDTILASPCHVIVTLRSKMAYAEQQVDGRKRVVKLGLQPIQREGVEYEFDVTGEMNDDNVMVITKDRSGLLQGQVYDKPTKAVGETIREWLSTGAEPRERPKPPPSAPDEKTRMFWAKTTELGFSVEQVCEQAGVKDADELASWTRIELQALLNSLKARQEATENAPESPPEAESGEETPAEVSQPALA